MNREELKAIVDNPTVSGRDRKAAEAALREMEPPAQLETLTLKQIVPHRFPEQSQRAYYRSRAFLSTIPLGDLAAEFLRDGGWKTMADAEPSAIDFREKFAKHRDRDKLKALWRAGEDVVDAEYRIDFADVETLPLFSLIYGQEKTPDEIADTLFAKLARAKVTYCSLAAEFPPEN